MIMTIKYNIDFQTDNYKKYIQYKITAWKKINKYNIVLLS